MASETFCPECGTQVKAGAAFCPNCGHNLTSAATEKKSESTAEPEDSTQKPLQRSTPVQPRKPLNKRMVGAVVAVVVILVAGYLGLKNYYQPQKQLERIITTMGNSDKNLAKYVKTSDPTLQNEISNKNLKPVQKYFENNRQELAALKSALQTGSTYDNTYSIEQSGNAWLLFPRYKLNIAAAYVTLSTNHAGVVFYQNGKKLATTTSSSDSKKVGPLFPGQYSFKAVGKIAGRKLVNTATTKLTAGSQSLPLKLKIATFTISGTKGATVYLNGKKVGELNSEGKLSFKDYPVSNDLKAYITLPVSGQTVKSKTINVSDRLAEGEHTIAPAFEGMVAKSDAEELLDNVFSGAQTGTDDSSTAELFVGQESNSSYNDLLKFFASFKTNSKIENYTAEVTKVNSVTPAGKNKATVSYSVKYTFNNSGDAGDSTKVQQFTYPNAEIVKQGSDYKIQTIGDTKSADWEKNYSNDN
ncbi:zinc ribbon domain-containing protein [Liquorilactobacillus satsumensis]|uniref:zinc ribbon domain-containing protein n=1 Tax=Liquorilactobacillus satsumensis TaxID=259059 RepID=UPI001E38A884|nr:zinc-ribbon domain-containing protein [Liquorilactobacillus satsumensis]MCC7667217.1 zinc ribbon domain-containing protein [Liquorilactobacillus satsumensis]